jgi:histidinol-phosphate aminotransferase
MTPWAPTRRCRPPSSKIHQQRDIEKPTINTLEPKTYNLSYNENPLGASPDALKAMRAELHGVNSYRHVSDEPLRRSLSQAFNYELGSDQFLPANGSLEILDLICRTYLKPGDEAIVSTPTIPEYAEYARFAGARVIDIPLDLRSFEPDIAGIIRSFTEKTRLIFLASPNNPTGAIMTRAQMDRLLLHLPPNTILVCDQVYHHYSTDPTYGPAAVYVKKGLPVIGIHSFSKAHGLAGMRIAYAFSTPAIIRTIRQQQRPFAINMLSIEAAIAALTDQGWIDKTIRSNTREKKWLYASFEKMGLRFWPSQASFILLRTPYDAALFTSHLLHKGFIVRGGGEFAARGCIRISIGTRPTNKAFVRAVQELI